jgi:Domain of unknown function (DUF4160)
MPAVAEFQGITLFIYYPPREHPPPHFHAIYADQDASFDIRTLDMTAGNLRPAQRKIVTEWASARQEELMDCWTRAMAGQQPGRTG